MSDRVEVGQTVLLLGPENERHILQVQRETKRIDGLGVVALGDWVGKSWGERIKIGLKEYVLLPPRLSDHVRSLERRAQIILPKDASRILFELGLRSGDRAIEGGVGSGALTLVLAHAVAPHGRIYAYEVRKDHWEVAQRNLQRAQLEDVVEFRNADVRQNVKEQDVHAFFVDIPDPEAVVPTASQALLPGGVFGAYTPLINQAERVSTALKQQGFLDVRTLELLERAWVNHERGSRPDFSMLGHTGFLTFARRSPSPFAEVIV